MKSHESRTNITTLAILIIGVVVAAGLVSLVGEKQNSADVAGLETQDLNKPSEDISKGYPVYINDNTDSEIIYYAQENEELSVFDQNEFWYGVRLPNGDQGWLLKANVKKANSSGL
jgi:hypothetical protein